MSIVVISDDFTATGTPSASTYTAISGAWTQDGTRVYPSSTTATEHALRNTALNALPLLTASTPQQFTIEVDITMPTPITSFTALGLTAWGRSSGRDCMTVTYEYSGTTHSVALRYIDSGTATPISFTTTSITQLVAGQTARLKALFEINGTDLTAIVSLASVIVIYAVLPLNVFAFATGRTSTTWASEPCYVGLFANVNGATGPTGALTGAAIPYLDRLRVTDTGSLANAPSLFAEPSLTATPSLTPISFTTEYQAASAGTLTVQPSYVVAGEDRWKVVDHPYDGGYTASAAAQSARRIVWHLGWEAISDAEKSGIDTLVAATLGTTGRFAWTPAETGVAGVYRFLTEPVVKLVGPSVYEMSADVEELSANG